jgi:hypothetical protein
MHEHDHLLDQSSSDRSTAHCGYSHLSEQIFMTYRHSSLRQRELRAGQSFIGNHHCSESIYRIIHSHARN